MNIPHISFKTLTILPTISVWEPKINWRCSHYRSSNPIKADKVWLCFFCFRTRSSTRTEVNKIFHIWYQEGSLTLTLISLSKAFSKDLVQIITRKSMGTACNKLLPYSQDLPVVCRSELVWHHQKVQYYRKQNKNKNYNYHFELVWVRATAEI